MSSNPIRDLPATAILRALPEGALICDASGRILSTNRHACRLFPTLSELGAHLNDVFADARMVASALRSALLANDDVPIEVDLRHTDSSVRMTLRKLDALTEDDRLFFLLRFDRAADQGGVRRQMMSLARTLTETAHENEALLLERDQLRRVVDETLPELEELSFKDALTGLGNRRAFDNALDVEWSRLSSRRVPISVVLIDVDHFKAYNDAFGHPQGDAVLTRVGETLRTAAAREGDLMCRIGGEEFALLLPNTDVAGAQRVADLARRSVFNLGIEHPVDRVLSVSAGVASTEPASEKTKRELLERADAALYRAKRSGRNRVVAAPERERSTGSVAALAG